jgi:hypothetical protein
MTDALADITLLVTSDPPTFVSLAMSTVEVPVAAGAGMRRIRQLEDVDLTAGRLSLYSRSTTPRTGNPPKRESDAENSRCTCDALVFLIGFQL